MKNSLTILHILKKRTYMEKNGRELRTLALVEWDVQPVLLQVVEAASCRRRHETKHSLMTQSLR
jgi:hypothetical protein